MKRENVQCHGITPGVWLHHVPESNIINLKTYIITHKSDMTKQEKHLLEVTLQAERAMVPFMLSLGIRPRILSSQIPHQSVLVSVVLQKMHDCNKTYTIAIRTHDCNTFHTIATYVSASLNHEVNRHEAQSVWCELPLRNGVATFCTLLFLIILEAELHPQ